MVEVLSVFCGVSIYRSTDIPTFLSMFNVLIWYNVDSLELSREFGTTSMERGLSRLKNWHNSLPVHERRFA